MKEKPHYIGHIDRLRKRYMKSGADGLQDYENLELLLSYALRGKDVKPLAKKLLKKFGSISAVLNAEIKELCEIKGISVRTAVLLKLAKDFTNIYFSERMENINVIDSPDAVIQFARARISGLKNETFLVVYVNKKNHVVHFEIQQEGTVDKTIIFPRKIMESALESHATGIILVHNHPGGSCEPSAYDRKLTKSLQDASRHFDIKIIDHIIVNDGGYYSFKENKIL